ncbi:universal stress protein [Novosphingobium sp. ZN18A2]|uniref:universal stress protein n=1 Tax=Novosphingobium sp. ZN18A2 TaxID=3079861 RepID=UPI0030D3FACF
MAQKRIYLVIMDETAEARLALRYAARRAVRTGGAVHILALVPKQDFSPFGGVQATIEEEARDRAEVLANTAASGIQSAEGLSPVISVREGDSTKVVRGYLEEHPEVSALVLGAAAEGSPGPLVSHFAMHDAGKLPCSLMIVPGSMSEDDVDRLS